MQLVVVIPFLNEERYLPTVLASVAAQSRLPDRLVLVDDGSNDRSFEIVSEFAASRPYAVALSRPRRPVERDRLESASELRAFQWALETTGFEFDIVAKIDADVSLTPRLFEEVERRFEQDPELGLTGAHLSTSTGLGQGVEREPSRPDHIRGANKFYRRACYDQIAPLPTILGWDTIDEFDARRLGWKTVSFDAAGGDPVQLRPTGTQDGRLRGFRRAGACAWGYGAAPRHVVLGGIRRMTQRPPLLGGLNFMAGWLAAGLRGRSRASPEIRAFV
ncbi:MAG: glycosyltransferase family A protein, partial [Acidimicrobiales bacterium]